MRFLEGTTSPLAPYLKAVVAEVGNEHSAVRCHCNSDRILKVAWLAASAPEARQKRAIRGKFLDPVIVKIGNENIAMAV